LGKAGVKVGSRGVRVGDGVGVGVSVIVGVRLGRGVTEGKGVREGVGDKVAVGVSVGGPSASMIACCSVIVKFGVGGGATTGREILRTR